MVKQGLTEYVCIEQLAKLQHRGGIGHVLAAQINADEAAQACAVVERLFARQFFQVKPVLDEVDEQHALQADGWEPLPALGQYGSITSHSADHGTMDIFHGLQERFSPYGLAVVLEARTLIGG